MRPVWTIRWSTASPADISRWHASRSRTATTIRTAWISDGLHSPWTAANELLLRTGRSATLRLLCRGTAGDARGHDQPARAECDLVSGRPLRHFLREHARGAFRIRRAGAGGIAYARFLGLLDRLSRYLGRCLRHSHVLHGASGERSLPALRHR